MKNLIYFIVLLASIVTVSKSEASICNRLVVSESSNEAYAARNPEEYVHMKNGDMAYGLFQCRHCNLWQPPKPNQHNKRRTCRGCSHPFDGKEAVKEPEFDNRGGQTYVKRKYLMTSERDINLFSQGPDWMCSSCESRNWNADTNCSGCGSSKSARDTNFNPFQKHEADVRPVNTATLNRSAKLDTNFESVPTAVSAPVVTQERSDNRASAPTITQQRADSRTGAAQQRDLRARLRDAKTLVISSALVGALAFGGAAKWAYNVTHPDAFLTGTVTKTVSEYVLFKDKAHYLQYEGVKLDLRNPPEGVSVILEKSVQVERAESGHETSEGYVVKMHYAEVEVNGKTLPVSLTPQEAQNWRKGDAVKVTFAGPHEYRYERR